MDSKVLNIFIELINGCKKNDVISERFADRDIALTNCNYLLGQMIRNYAIPADHWYISEAAANYWGKITDEPIWRFEYNDQVRLTKNAVLENVGIYSGASKTPTIKTIRRGESIKFNSLFHDEHMIDVKTIIQELKKLDPLGAPGVEIILDKIRLARILKDEDKRITKKSGRGMNMDKIMQLYKDADIKLIKRI